MLGWLDAALAVQQLVLHLYAEGETVEASEELLDELRGMVEEIAQGEAAEART